MADLSQMSDDDLQKLYAQAQAPKDAPATDLSHLTDEDLTKLYQQSQGQAAPASKVPPLMSSAVGAAQAVTLEHAPQIAAGANTLKDYLLSKINGEPLGVDFGTAYQRNLEHAQGRLEEAKSENPGFYTAGGIGGALGSAALLPEAAMATRGARLATGVALGAGAAGGASKHDPTQSSEELQKYLGDVAIGGGMGLVGGGLGEAIPAAIGAAKKVPGALEDIAERRAAKAAIGNQQKYWDQLERQGRVNDVGRELLDTGAVKAGGSARGIEERAEALQDKAWDAIAAHSDAIDKAAPDGAVSGKDIADKMRAWAVENDVPGAESTVSRMNDMADKFEAMGNMAMSKAQFFKNKYKFDPRDPNKLSIGQEATNNVNRAVGEAMENGFERIGATDPTLSTALADYQKAKKAYGAFATSSDAAGTLANRQEKNATFGVLPMLSATAAGHYGPLAQVAAAVGTKALRERGSSTMAVGADKLADILRATPEALGPFAPMLQDAATKGTTSLALTHYLLSKDPSYVQTVNQAAGATP